MVRLISPRLYLGHLAVVTWYGWSAKAPLTVHTGALGKPGWSHGTAYLGPVKVSW